MIILLHNLARVESVSRLPSSVGQWRCAGSQTQDTESPLPMKGDKSKDKDLILKAGQDKLIDQNIIKKPALQKEMICLEQHVDH